MKKDFAEEGILVTNLSIWQCDPAVIHENRPSPSKVGPGDEVYAISGHDIIDKQLNTDEKLFSLV